MYPKDGLVAPDHILLLILFGDGALLVLVLRLLSLEVLGLLLKAILNDICHLHQSTTEILQTILAVNIT